MKYPNDYAISIRTGVIALVTGLITHFSGVLDLLTDWGIDIHPDALAISTWTALSVAVHHVWQKLGNDSPFWGVHVETGFVVDRDAGTADHPRSPQSDCIPMVLRRMSTKGTRWRYRREFANSPRARSTLITSSW